MKITFLPKFFILFFLSFALLGCGISNPFKNIDWSETAEPDGRKRARANAEAGAGIGSGELFKGNKGGGSAKFEFASSNPLWRASLDTLDFFVFDTVDYSGGILITDWYSEGNTNESIKITLRFLTDEIRADALDVSIHKRNCFENNNCVVKKIDSDLSFDITTKILKKAAKLASADKDNELKTLKRRKSRTTEQINERYDN